MYTLSKHDRAICSNDVKVLNTNGHTLLCNCSDLAAEVFPKPGRREDHLLLKLLILSIPIGSAQCASTCSVIAVWPFWADSSRHSSFSTTATYGGTVPLIFSNKPSLATSYGNQHKRTGIWERGRFSLNTIELSAGVRIPDAENTSSSAYFTRVMYRPLFSG